MIQNPESEIQNSSQDLEVGVEIVSKIEFHKTVIEMNGCAQNEQL